MLFSRASDESRHVYNGCTVLVVDDDTDIRVALRALLEDEGYAVLEADDGAAALDILRASPDPLIVVTNHHMPHLDGPGLIEAVQRDPHLAALHALIFLTANPGRITFALREDLRQLHAPIVPKPFSVTALLDAVARAAERVAGTPPDEPPRPNGSSVPD